MGVNEQAAEVLTLCDGTRTAREVAACLAERYPDAPEDALLTDVCDVLGRLRARGFVQEAQ